MQSVIERYYNINKFFLTKVGGWPRQSRLARIVIPAVFLSVLFSIIILQFVRLLEAWEEGLDQICECIIIILFGIALYTKMYPSTSKRHAMEQLLSLMEYHWRLFTDSAEVEILNSYIITGRKIAKIYIVVIYTFMVLYMAIPVSPQILDIIVPINGSRPHKFMFEIYYNFDRDDYYYVVLLHGYVTGLITVTIMIAVDLMYLAFVQHGCSIFAVVGYRLEHITCNLEKNIMKGKSDVYVKNVCVSEDDMIYQELIECLYKHQICIEYINVINSVYSLYSAILLAISLIGASFVGIQLIALWDNHKEEVLRYICFFIGVYLHIFILSFPGERIIGHSSDIFYKAYNIEWYKLSRRTTRLICILLIRSMEPCKLTAAKITVLSMSNFASVVHTSMSYFITLSATR